MNTIELRSVSKLFGEHRAVDSVSMSVKKGEMFALVGPDGAGKTTTMRMLCGIVPPDEGELLVCGFDVQKQPSEVKNRLGYLSQKFSLYGDLTIDENIEFFAEIHRVRDYRLRREELLEFTRLTPFRSRFAENLSGGMKQKLALACTLIHTPEVIFLDEPTAGVDPVSRRDFWKILSSLLKTGITILMTTPYLDEAERCTRVAMMNKGRILVADTPQNLKEGMKGALIELVCNDIRKASALLKSESVAWEVQAFGDRLNIVVENEKKGMRKIVDVLKQNSIEVLDRRTIRPSLENVFISLLSEVLATQETVEGYRS
ncbi:MAG: ABC-type transport system ATPase component [Bacteroidetes bacterium]|nr:ABC-type transport system ATPase component [Bacteroidota bacterium]